MAQIYADTGCITISIDHLPSIKGNIVLNIGAMVFKCIHIICTWCIGNICIANKVFPGRKITQYIKDHTLSDQCCIT
ncbi:hypothetical protein D3C85_1277770 [compost metagenome]